MNLSKLFDKDSVYAEALKYTFGCGCGILLKIGINDCLARIGAPLWLGYLITTTIILFFSFTYHYFITFRNSRSGNIFKSFCVYVPSVAVFKGLDYLNVVIGAAALKSYLEQSEQLENWQIRIIYAACITMSSGVLFLLRFFVYRVIFKKRTAADLTYYTGSVHSVWTGYAADSAIASNAASGGFVTAFFTYLLKNDIVQGVVVSYFEMTESGPHAFAKIVTQSGDLSQSQGSIYMSYPLITADLLQQVRDFPGKIAVIALPCQCAALRKLAEKDSVLREKLSVIVGLFCGHTSKPELLHAVLEKKHIAMADIAQFRFRRGLGRGKTFVQLKNGVCMEFPSAFYNLYQNLFIHSAPQCLSCFDHFAEQADIACGDIWTWKHRKDTAKHSMICSHTECGENLLNDFMSSGCFHAESSTQHELFRANIRAAIYHKAIAARSVAFGRYGISLSVPEQARKACWNELLAARIIARIHASDQAGLLSVNRRVLKIALYVFKGLTNF